MKSIFCCIDISSTSVFTGIPFRRISNVIKLFEPCIMASDGFRLGQPVSEYIRHTDVKGSGIIKNCL